MFWKLKRLGIQIEELKPRSAGCVTATTIFESIGVKAFAYTTFDSIPEIHSDSLGEGAFMNCANARGSVLVDCKEISKLSFYGCTNIESIKLLNIVNISEEAFMMCNSLKIAKNLDHHQMN